MNQTQKQIAIIESNNNNEINLDLHGCIIDRVSNTNQAKTESDRKVYLYNRYYSYNDLFGSDSDGKIVIGAIKSPLNHQTYRKKKKTDIDIDSNIDIDIHDQLKAIKESDDYMYNYNCNKLKRRKKKKKRRKKSSLSSLELPIPSKSSLELQLERSRAVYMFDQEEQDYHQYHADCEEEKGNIINNILELNTDKILKGINRKHKVVSQNKPSQLLDTNTNFKKYKAMEKELLSWKKQYCELNMEYNASLERNDKLHQLQIENDELKQQLKEYKRTFECINYEIICIDNKYKLNKRIKVEIEKEFESEEEDGETEVEILENDIIINDLLEIKSRFAEFISGCEGIQLLFNNLHKKTLKLNVSDNSDNFETVCKILYKRYDEINKLWLEHVQNGRFAVEHVANMHMYETGVESVDNNNNNNNKLDIDIDIDIEYDFDGKSMNVNIEEVMMDHNRIKCDFV